MGMPKAAIAEGAFGALLAALKGVGFLKGLGNEFISLN
jgi:hypothetical protein